MQWYGRQYEDSLNRLMTRNLTAAAIRYKAALKDYISRPGRRNFGGKTGKTLLARGATLGSKTTRSRFMRSSLRSAAKARAAGKGAYGSYGSVMRRSGASGAKLRFGKRGANGRNLLGIQLASRPGEPPRRQTGELWRRIAHEVDRTSLIARIGTNLKYAAGLELGTKPYTLPRKAKGVYWNPETGEVFGKGPIRNPGIKPRPYFVPTLNRLRGTLSTILGRSM